MEGDIKPRKKTTQTVLFPREYMLIHACRHTVHASGARRYKLNSHAHGQERVRENYVGYDISAWRATHLIDTVLEQTCFFVQSWLLRTDIIVYVMKHTMIY